MHLETIELHDVAFTLFGIKLRGKIDLGLNVLNHLKYKGYFYCIDIHQDKLSKINNGKGQSHALYRYKKRLFADCTHKTYRCK